MDALSEVASRFDVSRSEDRQASSQVERLAIKLGSCIQVKFGFIASRRSVSTI